MILLIIAILCAGAFCAGLRLGRKSAPPPEAIYRDCDNPGVGEADGHVWVRCTYAGSPISLRFTIAEFDNGQARAWGNSKDDPWRDA